ncbi:hypothetical protein Tco_1458281 [Tanacetum coccineum]
MLKASPLKHVKRGRDTKIPQSSGPLVKVGDEAVHKELGDRIERAATTASSLEVEQDSGNGPRVNTLGSGEDSMKLMELMAHCTKLSELGTASTARTTDDGEVEITANIDGQVKTITEVSLRRHLKLEDSDGITSLPNTKIFKQLALMGTFNFSKMIFDAMVKNLDSTHKFLMYPRFLQICLNKQKRLLQPHTRTYLAHTLTKKLFSNMKRASRGYYGFPTQTQVADEVVFTSVDVNAEGAATTDIGLEAGQGSGTMHKTPTRPHDSPLPRVHTLRIDEGSLQQNELMDLVTKLTDKVEVLENDL